MRPELPYFLNDVVGIGGALKQRPEDFRVTELPAYTPSGDGEHLLIEIEKTGLSTFEAIDTVAKRLNVPRRDIGYAGLKDANAVTRQWLSVRGTTLDCVDAAASNDLKILFVEPHRNKLRVGHLRGNRFSVRVREVDPMKVVTLAPAIATLVRRGMPNYFGEQRFGRRDQNDALGLAYARRDADEVLSLLLGRPDDGDGEAERAARTAYDDGDIAKAYALWPRRDRDEAAALRRLLDGKSPADVVAAVDRRIVELWLSALQSRMFNSVVAARLVALDELVEGDLSFKHDNGASFRVTDVETERVRVAPFEISATGPIFGSRMTPPTGEAAMIERTALVDAGLPEDAVASVYEPGAGRDAPAWLGGLGPGARRPLRVRPDGLRTEAGIDEHGPYIQFDFTLPPGAYATTLLREFMRA